MKHLIGTLPLILLLTAASHSQVGFGVKGGVNLASLGGSNVTSIVKSKTGFAAGFYLNISIPYLFSVQPEVLYSTKGATYKQNVPVPSWSEGLFLTDLAYLDIPVLIEYSVPIPLLTPSLYVGPQMSILLKAKGGSDYFGQITSEDIKSQTASPDWGVALGASVNIFVIRLDVRYTAGVKSINGYSPVYNRDWSIMAEVPLY